MFVIFNRKKKKRVIVHLSNVTFLYKFLVQLLKYKRKLKYLLSIIEPSGFEDIPYCRDAFDKRLIKIHKAASNEENVVCKIHLYIYHFSI